MRTRIGRPAASGISGMLRDPAGSSSMTRSVRADWPEAGRSWSVFCRGDSADCVVAEVAAADFADVTDVADGVEVVGVVGAA
ncbi:hypothetical protein GCM10010431_09530 [Streptomyces kunmingensis]